MPIPESHNWYDRQGNPVWEIEGANGKMRKPHLGDARKLGLLPGSTGVMKVKAKPALENWKIDQALLSALTLPRIEGETEDKFMDRAKRDSMEQVREAAKRGKAIHAAIEGYFSGEPIKPEFVPYVEGTKEEMKYRLGNDILKQPWVAESSFGCPLGYGGRPDLDCPVAVADFKCKDFTEDSVREEIEKKRAALIKKKGLHDAMGEWKCWPENAMQLASYERGREMRGLALVNFIISTREPGLVVSYVWEDNDHWLEGFLRLLKVWQWEKNYDSSFTK